MAKYTPKKGAGPLWTHPHAVGIHPVKDIGQANGPGYKVVSRAPFKRYAHEDNRHPYRNATPTQLRGMLRDSSINVAVAKELLRRWKNRRHIGFGLNRKETAEVWKLVLQLTGFKPKRLKPLKNPIIAKVENVPPPSDERVYENAMRMAKEHIGTAIVLDGNNYYATGLPLDSLKQSKKTLVIFIAAIEPYEHTTEEGKTYTQKRITVKVYNTPPQT